MVTRETMYPSLTPIENKIKLLLVMKGYDRSKIGFRNDFSGVRELRYGYWDFIKRSDIEYVETFTGIKFEPFLIEDDDCGPLYSYNFKEIKNGKSRNSAN
jgi:hypothetical protein